MNSSQNNCTYLASWKRWSLLCRAAETRAGQVHTSLKTNYGNAQAPVLIFTPGTAAGQHNHHCCCCCCCCILVHAVMKPGDDISHDSIVSGNMTQHLCAFQQKKNQTNKKEITYGSAVGFSCLDTDCIMVLYAYNHRAG